MRPSFDGIFKFSIHALAAAGFYSLYISGYAGPIMTISFAVLLAVSWNREKLPFDFSGYQKTWNLLLLLSAAWLAVDGIFLSLNLVENAMLFTILLQINRLLCAKTYAEYMHVVLVAFLQLTAATVFTEDITFVIPFIMFLIFGTWALILYTIRTQVKETFEENEGEVRAAALGKTRDVVTKKFLFGTAVLSLAVLIATMSVFYIFPRVSFGFFHQMARRPAVSGFSNQVAIGKVSQIKQNKTPVMRIIISEEDRKKLGISGTKITGIYWRGTALDTYDGKTWYRSKNTVKKLYPNQNGMIKTNEIHWSDTKIKQEIYLEPVSDRTVFAMDKVLSIGWKRTFLERVMRRDLGLSRDFEGGLSLLSNYSADRYYIAVSDPAQPPESLLAEDTPFPAYAVKYVKRYLKLPNNIDPRIISLAKKITSGKKTLYEKITAIENFLLQNYSYTLKPGKAAPNEDPLARFLFKTKKGHCEYFSTALAVLGRAAGVPTRNVVGFLGGTWNKYGNYIIVREADAHTWVEALFPQAGWVRFDATPPAGAISKEPNSFEKFMDYIRLRWLRYVVEYDIRTQKKTVSKVAKGIATTPKKIKNMFLKIRTSLKKIPAGRAAAILIALLTAALAIYTAAKNTKKYKHKKQRALALKEWKRFVKIAEKKGVPCDPTTTPMELSQKIEVELRRPSPHAEKAAEYITELRWSAHKLPPSKIEELKRTLDELKKELYR